MTGSPAFDEQRLEVAVDDVLPVEQPARLVAEDQVRVLVAIPEPQLPPLLCGAVTVERPHGPIPERHGAVAARLGGAGDLLAVRVLGDGPLHPERGLIEVGPPERQRTEEGWEVVRFWESDVLRDLGLATSQIIRRIQQRCASTDLGT